MEKEAKRILEILNTIELKQTGWEGDEDIMTFNGEPIGATIRNTGLEIDRWWSSLKRYMAEYLAEKLVKKEV